jgi:glycerol-3-phosphate cytidylyltransferase
MKIGITFSAFDLLHAGHVKMLEEAKLNCDYLIVGLQTDPTLDRPTKKQTYSDCCRTLHTIKGV